MCRDATHRGICIIHTQTLFKIQSCYILPQMRKCLRRLPVASLPNKYNEESLQCSKASAVAELKFAHLW
jgi:hypothetical protein